jgi:hypothetical protein
MVQLKKEGEESKKLDIKEQEREKVKKETVKREETLKAK